MGMTRHFVDALIAKGWKPYIKRQWLDFGTGKSGYIITFKDHEQHTYKCSKKTGNELLKQVESK